ncbi:hypothetical protein V8E54_013980 [Elaphomyces granulatus]
MPELRIPNTPTLPNTPVEDSSLVQRTPLPGSEAPGESSPLILRFDVTSPSSVQQDAQYQPPAPAPWDPLPLPSDDVQPCNPGEELLKEKVDHENKRAAIHEAQLNDDQHSAHTYSSLPSRSPQGDAVDRTLQDLRSTLPDGDEPVGGDFQQILPAR